MFQCLNLCDLCFKTSAFWVSTLKYLVNDNEGAQVHGVTRGIIKEITIAEG